MTLHIDPDAIGKEAGDLVAAAMRAAIDGARAEGADAERRRYERQAARDAEIVKASAAVARASDALAQVRFAGRDERRRRIELDKACDALARAMHRQGRI